jgi:hypothetical protein
MATTPQFSTLDPLIIRIEQDEDGEWTIRPSKIDRSGGKTHSQIMDERRQLIEPAVLDDWTTRRAAGAPRRPHFKTEAGHVPVIVTQGEKILFRSQDRLPFTIWIDRDPNVVVDAAGPQSPFGLSLPHNSTDGESSLLTVAANVFRQRFYKCTAYVQVAAGNTIVVDPDVIGD